MADPELPYKIVWIKQTSFLICQEKERSNKNMLDSFWRKVKSLKVKRKFLTNGKNLLIPLARSSDVVLHIVDKWEHVLFINLYVSVNEQRNVETGGQAISRFAKIFSINS